MSAANQSPKQAAGKPKPKAPKAKPAANAASPSGKPAPAASNAVASVQSAAGTPPVSAASASSSSTAAAVTPAPPTPMPPASGQSSGGPPPAMAGPPGAVQLIESLLGRVPEKLPIMNYRTSRPDRHCHTLVSHRTFLYSEITNGSTTGHNCARGVRSGVRCGLFRAHRTGICREVPYIDLVPQSTDTATQGVALYFDIDGVEPPANLVVVSGQTDDASGQRAVTIIHDRGTVPLADRVRGATVIILRQHDVIADLRPTAALLVDPRGTKRFVVGGDSIVTAEMTKLIGANHRLAQQSQSEVDRRVIWVFPSLEDDVRCGDLYVIPQVSVMTDSNFKIGADVYRQADAGTVYSQGTSECYSLSLPLMVDSMTYTTVTTAHDKVMTLALRKVATNTILQVPAFGDVAITRHNMSYIRLPPTPDAAADERPRVYIMPHKLITELSRTGAASSTTAAASAVNSRSVCDAIGDHPELKTALCTLIPSLVVHGDARRELDAREATSGRHAEQRMLGNADPVRVVCDHAQRVWDITRARARVALVRHPLRVLAGVTAVTSAVAAIAYTHPTAVIATFTVTATCYAVYVTRASQEHAPFSVTALVPPAGIHMGRTRELWEPMRDLTMLEDGRHRQDQCTDRIVSAARRLARNRHLKFVSSLAGHRTARSAAVVGCGNRAHTTSPCNGSCTVCVSQSDDMTHHTIPPVHSTTACLHKSNNYVRKMMGIISKEVRRHAHEETECPLVSNTVDEITVMELSFAEADRKGVVLHDHWVSLMPFVHPGAIERVFCARDESAFLRYIRRPGPMSDEEQPNCADLLTQGMASARAAYVQNADVTRLRQFEGVLRKMHDPTTNVALFQEEMAGHPKAALYTGQLKRCGRPFFGDRDKSDRDCFVKSEVKKGSANKTTLLDLIDRGVLPPIDQVNATNIGEILETIRTRCDLPRLIRIPRDNVFEPHVLHKYVDAVIKDTLGFKHPKTTRVTAGADKHRVHVDLNAVWASAGSPADWSSFIRHGLTLLEDDQPVAAVDFSSFDHSQSREVRAAFYRAVRDILRASNASDAILQWYDRYAEQQMATAFSVRSGRRGAAIYTARVDGQNMSGDRETGLSNTLIHHGVLIAAALRLAACISLCLARLDGVELPPEAIAFLAASGFPYHALTRQQLLRCLRACEDGHVIDIMAILQGDDALYFSALNVNGVNAFVVECAYVATEAGIISKCELQTHDQINFCGRHWMMCRHPEDHRFGETYCSRRVDGECLCDLGPHLDADLVIVHPNCFATQNIVSAGAWPERVADFVVGMRVEERNLAIPLVPVVRTIAAFARNIDSCGHPTVSREDLSLTVRRDLRKICTICPGYFACDAVRDACERMRQRANMYAQVNRERYQAMFGAASDAVELGFIREACPAACHRFNAQDALSVALYETAVSMIWPPIAWHAAADEAYAYRAQPVVALSHFVFHTVPCHYKPLEVACALVLHTAADTGTTSGIGFRDDDQQVRAGVGRDIVRRLPAAPTHEPAPTWLVAAAATSWVCSRVALYHTHLPISIVVRCATVVVNALAAGGAFHARHARRRLAGWTTNEDGEAVPVYMPESEDGSDSVEEARLTDILREDLSDTDDTFDRWDGDVGGADSRTVSPEPEEVREFAYDETPVGDWSPARFQDALYAPPFDRVALRATHAQRDRVVLQRVLRRRQFEEIDLAETELGVLLQQEQPGEDTAAPNAWGDIGWSDTWPQPESEVPCANYEGDPPHLSAWTSSEEPDPTVCMPEPLEIVPDNYEDAFCTCMDRACPLTHPRTHYGDTCAPDIAAALNVQLVLCQHEHVDVRVLTPWDSLWSMHCSTSLSIPRVAAPLEASEVRLVEQAAREATCGDEVDNPFTSISQDGVSSGRVLALETCLDEEEEGVTTRILGGHDEHDTPVARVVYRYRGLQRGSMRFVHPLRRLPRCITHRLPLPAVQCITSFLGHGAHFPTAVNSRFESRRDFRLVNSFPMRTPADTFPGVRPYPGVPMDTICRVHNAILRGFGPRYLDVMSVVVSDTVVAVVGGHCHVIPISDVDTAIFRGDVWRFYWPVNDASMLTTLAPTACEVYGGIATFIGPWATLLTFLRHISVGRGWLVV